MSPACSPVWPGITRTTLCILFLSGFCCLHQYHLINESKTWNEAQAYCREKYTDLATIDNMEDMEQLIAAAGSGYEGKVWIGLYDQPESWYWSLGAPSFYVVGGQYLRDFRRWSKGEPNGMRTNDWLCAALQQGFWSDYPCSDPHTFVCYKNTSTEFGSSATNNESYVFINKEMSWYSAVSYCRQNYTDLASVRNETENTMIQQMVGNQTAWIGLYSSTWSWWSDGTDPSFRNWVDGHPYSLTESCAASVINATYLGKWVENNCNEKSNFVCHNNKRQLFKIKLKVLKSTIDLNDPVVTEAILNLMEKKMVEKGISDFKISWIEKPDKNIFHKEKKAEKTAL